MILQKNSPGKLYLPTFTILLTHFNKLKGGVIRGCIVNLQHKLTYMDK